MNIISKEKKPTVSMKVIDFSIWNGVKFGIGFVIGTTIGSIIMAILLGGLLFLLGGHKTGMML